MRSRLPQTITRLRPAPGRRMRERQRRPDAAAPAAAPASPPLGSEARARAAGGPEDRASYTCSCGMVFDAPVSTSVVCPHCGADQAW